MISEVKKALAKNIRSLFPDRKIYLENVKQGLEVPCFFIKLINLEKRTVAYIDYMNVFHFDIIHISKNDKTLNKDNETILMKLSNLNSIQFETENLDITNTDIHLDDDGSLHYIIEIKVPINFKEIEPINTTYKLIKDNLNNISDKKIYYLTGNLEQLKNGFFVIEPNTTETVNISLNSVKEYERDIVIRYITLQANVDIPSFLENVMDKLISKIKNRNIYKVNYNLDIEYDVEDYNGFSVVNHTISLFLTERK